MFKDTLNRIKSFSFRKFILKNFKVCIHKYDPKENTNKFGQFKFEQCEFCNKTINTELFSNRKSEIKFVFSQEREDKLSKILDK